MKEIEKVRDETEDQVVDHTTLASFDPSGRLYNADLAPTPPNQRKWNTYSLFALWMNDAHNIGNYTFAAALFALGLSAWETTTAILFGTIILFCGCVLSGFMGSNSGAPFAVVSRISWGVFGANVPALVRAFVAIMWYGIQTYVASAAISAIFLHFFGSFSAALTHHEFIGLNALSWLSFIILWAIQLAILSRGLEAVRHFQGWCGPLLWLVMIVLAVWLVIEAHGNLSLTASVKHLSAGGHVYQTIAGVSLMVGALFPIMLNFSDFARFAPSKRAVIRGNFWGLPVNWTLFAFTSVVISAGSLSVFGHVIINPAEIFQRMSSGILLLVGAIVLILAALGVNIVANFVSPAYDLANVWPKHIDFRRGGIIAAIVAVVSLPWKLYTTPVVIVYLLGGLGAVLGPLFGVMIVDYFILRRQHVDVAQLYIPDKRSEYYYWRGINPVAVASFIPAAILSIIVAFLPALSSARPFAWCVGVASSGLLYYAIGRGRLPLPINPGKSSVQCSDPAK